MAILELDTDDRGVATLTLNRPEVHNAFNAELVAALSETLDNLADNGNQVRAVVLTGAGRSFSAGADLNWMRSMAEASEDENRDDAARLAAMLRKLDELPFPTIARVNGPTFGGGVGLVACCDMAVAADDALFGFTEVRLGLIPATIAPFVIARIGRAQARRYMLTAERMDALMARRIGLVHEITDPNALTGAVEKLITPLLAAGPGAVAECKRLIRTVAGHRGTAGELDTRTAEWIARLRVSDEGKEGLSAFLDKRNPEWRED